MLYEIGKELRAAFVAQGVPYPVVFGHDEVTDTAPTRERVELRRSVDSVGGPMSVHPNPRMPLVRMQGVTIRIFVRSPLAGAAPHDHMRLAEQVSDHVFAELDAIVRSRRNQWTIGACQFVEPKDTEGSVIISGAVYEIQCAISRGIFRRRWDGSARPTSPPLTAITSITRVSQATAAQNELGDPPGEAEPACGA